MNYETMHGWTDATALQQLATNANDNVTHQEVDPGIVLGSVCI